ncbi:MAG TPA: hypothetical protein VFU00_09545 [Gemmatimonadales bacterium]|nr:hypothetical protein [Gemmatimonadales bacterium]
MRASLTVAAGDGPVEVAIGDPPVGDEAPPTVEAIGEPEMVAPPD